MRYIIYGAGAIGGMIGAKLHLADHEVVLIARGEHLRVIQREGLSVRTPEESLILPITAAGHPREIDFRQDDVVLLTMKSQDTEAALDELRQAAGTDLAVLCAQNGVENERIAARRFARVYGMVIMMPASYLEPGVVETSQWPFIGVADIGCYPEGRDLFANILADELGSAGVFSMAREDIMAWKYAKMLMNVGNAVDAICGSDPNVGEVMQLVRAEAEECYRAAGIVYKHGDEYGNRSSSFRLANQALNPSKSQQPAVPQRTSSWQSLMRGTGSSESDFFNGEIALLGRLHGFSTPANEVLQDLSDRQARQKAKPGSMTADDVLRLIAERRTRSVRA